MTEHIHDTFADLDQGTSAIFTWSARLLPVAICSQFFLAGQALFAGMSWSAHGVVGGLTGLPIVVMAVMTICVSYLRGFAWWACGVLVLYAAQIALATGGATTLALHPFNASLLLTAALVLLVKTERRRALHG